MRKIKNTIKPRKKISEQSKTDEAKNSTKGGKTKIETLKKRGKHTYAINPGSSTNKFFFYKQITL